MHKAVNLKKLGFTRKTKALWSMRDAKANGEAYYDQTNEQQVEGRTSVRRALWDAHMKSPTAALEEGFRRTEDGAGRAQSSTAGGSETGASMV